MIVCGLAVFIWTMGETRTYSQGCILAELVGLKCVDGDVARYPLALIELFI